MYLASRKEIAREIGTLWQRNATRFGGVPLHPSGERSYFEFVADNAGELDARRRWQMVFQQTLIATIVLGLFVSNTASSISMVRARPRALATWCCLLQSVAGIMCAVYVLTTGAPGGPSCREILWVMTACIRINDLCGSTVLLQKAYIARGSSRWLLAFIPVVAVAPIPILYATWSSPAILNSTSGGCVFIYPIYFPWMRFGFHAPINLALTVIFIDVAYRQYQRFGSDAWRKLARDGIQVGLLLLVVNMLCTFAIALEVFGIYSIALTIVEW
ncbi:hypothetical protein THASP1DRAFT_27595 [Thamnocephalis sphaerospora]|uniref:Uncharacterized protein n=1 Tax=Thamnocephalis sphaerospora TaxID=78915 RepID=A0A4P9XWD7_9FUNG|nr:hypothetical protein THASP1DRAFT_27595 [Thamnocephalis sphaerospora]|eukprot:RKP10627.1 hypothetical protein THASP1DRAFT_27595 [Thamnocephalis sphaerospora]